MIRAADKVIGRRRFRIAQGNHDAALRRGGSRGGDRGVEGGQVGVRDDAPRRVQRPLFAAMSSDDPLSGQSGFEVVQAWQKRGVAELHLYGLGGHNFGMGHEPFTSALWPEQFLAFLRMTGMLKPAD